MIGDAEPPHKCNICERGIHAICGQPVVINGDTLEGYGTPRTCTPCLQRDQTVESEEQLDHNVEDLRIKKTKYGKYFIIKINDAGIKTAVCCIPTLEGKSRHPR